MLQKINNLIPGLIKKATKAAGKISAPVRLLGLLYFVFVALVLLLYVGLFCFEYIGGRAVSKDLLQFINILIGGAMIGFVTFILTLCIDSDGDGIPNAIDDHDDRPKENGDK